jgi:hypothetical protein
LLFLIREVCARPSAENVGKILVSIFCFPIIDLPGMFPKGFLVFYCILLALFAVSLEYKIPVFSKWLLPVCSLYFTLGTSTALTTINSREGTN